MTDMPSLFFWRSGTSGNPVGRVDSGGEEDTLFELSLGLGVQQTIAAAFVGGAVFAVGTSAQGGSVGQVLQSYSLRC